MKKKYCYYIFLFSLANTDMIAKRSESVWRELLENNAECVTWVSVTAKVEMSVGGRSIPPQEQKLEALGTVIDEKGLTVLSLNQVDPTANILSRLRSPGASVNVNYTEVFILMQDGTEVAARFLLKDSDLDLAFVLPFQDDDSNSDDVIFSKVPEMVKDDEYPMTFDEVVSIGKLKQTLYRQSTLETWFS